ncbi:hypothetical protein NQ315_015346 [Exocentrus adspersus]|uniref:Zinc finger BED domain-containing protein 1-like n=1 Tax=Exocentrus adspersus TaxID=1586481 RepID=A0AAV8V5I2_9CUCU|nr:hypothetical protein NQ315_015346 [Exocentrus adspersus]
MERKHPLVKLNDDRVSVVENTQEIEIISTELMVSSKDPQVSSDLSQPSTSNSPTSAETERPKIRQTTVNTFLKRKMGVTYRKAIDEGLLLLFTHDYQPFSIVEDYGFKKFVSLLNPSYEIPSRKSITRSLLPAAYEQVYNYTKNILDDMQSVCLTTDCWTSQNSESFLAVTAQFLTKNFKLKTLLLECVSFPESHTSSNLATELKRIITEWNMNKQPKKLITVIMWNSTYLMIQKFVELEEPIRTTMTIINKELPIISVEEWKFLKEIVEILKPLETLTGIMSGEKYVTASSVIILTDGLADVYEKFKMRSDFNDLSVSVVREICEGIKNRLGDLENSLSLITTTFLDPRFKNVGFS